MLNAIGKLSAAVTLVAGAMLFKPVQAQARVPEACTAEEEAFAACMGGAGGTCYEDNGEYWCRWNIGCFVTIDAGNNRVIQTTQYCSYNGNWPCEETAQPCS